MYVIQMVSAAHYSLKAPSLKWLLVWKEGLNMHFKDRREWGASDCPSPVHRWASNHIVLLNSFNKLEGVIYTDVSTSLETIFNQWSHLIREQYYPNVHLCGVYSRSVCDPPRKKSGNGKMPVNSKLSLKSGGTKYILF